MTGLPMEAEKLGTELVLHGSGPHSMDDESMLWVVLDGGIDLFLAQRLVEGTTGARHHLLRISKGDVCFGMCPGTDGALFAVACSAETRLLSITASRFWSLLEGGDIWAAEVLDAWVRRMCERLRAGNPPESYSEIVPGGVVACEDEARAVVAIDGVVWIRVEQGEARIGGGASLPVLCVGDCLPLSRNMWLQAQSGCVARAEAPTRQGWETLRSVLLLLLVHERDRTAQEEDRRVRGKSVASANRMERALQRLTTPLHSGTAEAVSDTECSHPIFLAFQAAAAELSVTLQPPPEMLRGNAMRDPVAAIAAASSVRVRKVVLKGEWWRENSGPFVAFTREGQLPRALLSHTATPMRVLDPSDGSSSPLDEAVAADLHPMAYSIYRGFPTARVGLGGLLRFGAAQCRAEMLTIVLTGAAAGLLAIVNPYATGILFDRLIPGAERNPLLGMGGLLAVLAITSTMFTLTRGFAVLRLQGRMETSIQAALWDRLLGLPVSFFRDYSAGDLAQRVMGISQIREAMTGSALNALLSGIFSIFSFILLFCYSLELARLATLLTLAACLVTLGMGYAQLKHRRDTVATQGRLSSRLLQFIAGVAKLRVSNAETRAFLLWARQFASQKSAATAARRIGIALQVFNAMFPILCTGILFYSNQRMLEAGTGSGLSTGGFLAFLAAFTQFLAANLNLSSTLLNVANIVPLYERARPLLEALPEAREGMAAPGRLRGEIEVSHVTFAYRPDLPPVLRDLTLRVRPGEFAAFVGPSGCGKSTLLRLLLCFDRPASGSIYFDGQDLSGLDAQAVRRQIGVVLQSSRLVSGSIFENIAGSLPVSVDEVWRACRMAGIEDDIRQMAMGLHTMISDGDGGVSGGQRQRILIARAVIANPRILIFDEATSALDNHTQEIVTRSLAGLQATRIVIAHRLSTIRDADRIFVFDRGQVVDSGSYEELMTRSSAFQALAKRQIT